MTERRFVFDTNVLVSALLLENSVPFRALERAGAIGILLFSSESYAELVSVLIRRRFDRYLPLEERMGFADALRREGEWIDIVERVSTCRDPKDDQFLDVAVNGHAEVIVTGDRDLLDLHPFRGIAVIPPDAFLRDLAR